MDVLEIYENLKERIIWLDIKPESTFNLDEVAKSFGVSRYPITMALARLESEDLVVRHGSHFVAGPLSLERVKETVEIRLVLEVQANVWAMNRIKPEEMNILEAISREMMRLGPEMSTLERLKLDLRFHQAIYKAAKNNQCAQMLQRILNQFFRYWLNVPYNIEPRLDFEDTLTIIDSIKKNDETRLRETSINHIKGSFRRIMQIS